MAAVKDIMSRKVHTIGCDEPLSAAAQKMAECGIRHIVVVNQDGAPQGVFSERDVLRYLVRSLNNPSQRPKDAIADELTARQMISIKPDTLIVEAAATMAEKRIGCLPVMDNEKLVGIVTTIDILNHKADDKPAKEHVAGEKAESEIAATSESSS